MVLMIKKRECEQFINYGRREGRIKRAWMQVEKWKWWRKGVELMGSQCKRNKYQLEM